MRRAPPPTAAARSANARAAFHVEHHAAGASITAAWLGDRLGGLGDDLGRAQHLGVGQRLLDRALHPAHRRAVGDDDVHRVEAVPPEAPLRRGEVERGEGQRSEIRALTERERAQEGDGDDVSTGHTLVLLGDEVLHLCVGLVEDVVRVGDPHVHSAAGRGITALRCVAGLFRRATAAAAACQQEAQRSERRAQPVAKGSARADTVRGRIHVEPPRE